MSTHEDDSATVVADGIEYPCHAKLRRITDQHESQAFATKASSEGLTSWGGTLTVQGDAYAVYQAEDLQLRTNGRTGTFVIAPGGNLGEGVLRINGNNAPPFD
ncbi:hypothetical protein ABZX90_38515 [Streptomyces sp. NPDC002935]|uniref:hypothetical protein n=1 Tax=Streptomyces sp. NPDC002935 TaxID=3154545 RepID=UPI0033B1EB30